MPDFTRDQRADSSVAGTVVDSLLRRGSADARRAFLEFLATSIERAVDEYPDRWGLTLFSDCLRLNVGCVECLVAFEDGINVLVEAGSTPVEFQLNGRKYRRAPGCEMTTLAVSDWASRLPALTDCHRSAIAIAARCKTTPAIRSAHSAGVIEWLSKQLGRPLPQPSYPVEDRAEEGDLVEGARKSYVLSRYEYDPRNRAKCLAHYGPACAVCGMTFAQQYGPDTKDCIEVHHLRPLADVGKAHEVPVEHLRPVCPNCHEVIHRGSDRLLDIKEAKALLRHVDTAN